MLSKSVKETAEIAKSFLTQILKDAKYRKGALVVAISGDLGAGKTAFAKASAKHLGIKEKVASPTFIIMKKYAIRLEGYKFLFHLDAFRLRNDLELLALGWSEIIGNKEHIIFIEWPENVPKIIPRSARHIHIKSDKDGKRNLELK